MSEKREPFLYELIAEAACAWALAVTFAVGAGIAWGVGYALMAAPVALVTLGLICRQTDD